MNNFFILIICILYTCISLVKSNCPQWNKDSPCLCGETKIGIMIRCSGTLGSWSRVLSDLSQVRTSTLWELQLESLTIDELPPHVFSVSSLHISHSNVRRLHNLGPSTWPNLNEIVFESVTFEESLWPQLKGASVLKFVKVSNVRLSTIGQEFRESLPTSIEYIELRKTSTSRIEPECMSHLINLRYVFITDIPLTQFPRNALPPAMNQLHTFVLGNTHIKRLEYNFFEGMPKLQVLMINGNKFTTLDAHLFTPLQSHLNHMLAERNPLPCQCNLLWIKTFNKKRSINIIATCYDANTEQVKEIVDLNEEDYCF